LRIVTVVQQFRTEFSGAVSEEEKIIVITKSDWGNLVPRINVENDITFGFVLE
jgi:hypothetical protein